MKRPASIVIFSLVILIFSLFLTPKILNVERLKDRSRNLELELLKLKRDNLLLANELRLLKEDPVYLEKIARQKFNKAKPGEIVYKIVREDDGKGGAK